MAEDKTPKKIDNTLAKTIESRVKRTVHRPDNSAVLLQRQLKADGRKLENVSSVSKSVENNFNILSRKFDLVSAQFVKVEQRITDYDKIVNEKFSVAGSLIQAQHMRMGQELSRSFKQIDSTLKSVDTRLGRQNQRIDTLKRELDFLKLRTKENDLRYTRMMTPKLPQAQKEKSGMTLKQAAVGTILGAALTGALIWAYNNRETIMDIYERLKKAAAVAGDVAQALGLTGSAKAATTTAKVGVSATKTVTRTVSRGKTAIINAIRKALGKQGIAIGAKKVPVFGMLVGAGMAAYRAAIGDKEGAMLELGSGATSMIPGVGTVGSLAIDVGIIARDAYFEMYQVYPREDPLAKERWQELYDTVIEYMSGSSKEENEKQAREKTSGAAHKALQQNQGRGISKNAVTVASTEKGETKNVEIKTAGDIFIDSLRKIKMEAKDEIRLKANKIILDAPKIEILTPRSGVTYGAQTSGSSSSSSKLEYPTNPKDPGAARAKEILSGRSSGSGYDSGSSYDPSGSPDDADVALPPIKVDNGPSATIPHGPPAHVVDQQSLARTGVTASGGNSGYMMDRQGRGSVPTKVTDPVGVSSQSQQTSQVEQLKPGVGRIDTSQIKNWNDDAALKLALLEVDPRVYGWEATQQFMETLRNRTLIRGRDSITTSLTGANRKYWGNDNGARALRNTSLNMNKEDAARLRETWNRVKAGETTAVTKGMLATDNASADLARRRFKSRGNGIWAGEGKHQELYYVDTAVPAHTGKRAKELYKQYEDSLKEQTTRPEKTRDQFYERHGPPMMLGNPISENPNDIIKKVVDGKLSPQSKAFEDAMTQHGLHERKDRQALQSYLGGWNPVGKQNAWCSVFVNNALKNAGIKPTGSAVASSYLNWGQQISDAKEVSTGDVLVRTHSRKGSGRRIKPGETGSHVSLASGESRWVTGSGRSIKVVPEGTKGARLQLQKVGGNQSDTVSTRWVDANQVQVRRSHEQIAYMKQQQETRIAETQQPNAEKIDQPQVISAQVQPKPKPQLVDTPPKPIMGTQSTPADHSSRNVAQNGRQDQTQVASADGPKPGSSEYWGSKPAKSEETAVASADDDMSSRGIEMPRNPYAGDNMMPGPGDSGTGEYGEQCLV